MSVPQLRWSGSAKLQVGTAEGLPFQPGWQVEILGPGGSPLAATSRADGEFYAPELRPGNLVTVATVWRASQSPDSPAALHRLSFRLSVPEMEMTSFDKESANAQVAKEQGDLAEEGVEVRALLALDFGTYAQCAAVWDPTMQSPSIGRLTEEQLSAAGAAAGGLDFRSADDIELDAGDPYLTGGEADSDLRAAAWEAAFGVPPMAHHYVKMLIDAPFENDAPIPLSDDSQSYLARFGARGLKRRLLEEQPSKKILDELVNAYLTMYNDSVEIISGGESRRRRPLYVDVTYPTRLPTPQLEALLKVLKEELPRTLGDAGKRTRVRAGFDEATAVALLDLCARLGQRRELGVAALQARHGSPTWAAPVQGDGTRLVLTDRVLVVDVGAGTTDVALLDLHVYDDTPPEVVAAPGRYWRIEPRVVASGGALDFGADQLTLNVFSTLKKRLSNAGDDWRTQFERHPERLADFLTLWRTAESAKETMLSADARKHYTVTVEHSARSDEVGAKGPTSIKLDYDMDLRASVEQFARRVAILAVGIAEAGLVSIERRSGTAPDSQGAKKPQIDRIILAGASFTSPLLGELVDQNMRVLLRDRNRAATYELALHRGYLKAAAALGAAYGGMLEKYYVERQHPKVIAGLQAGFHYFAVDRLGLRANLPAEFKADYSGQKWDIFERGQEFDGGTGAEDDLRWARSRTPLPVYEGIGIERFDAAINPDSEDTNSPGKPMTWCHFDFVNWGGFRQRHPEVSEDARSGISMTFEVNEHLSFTMFAHHGPLLPLDLSEGTELVQDPAGPDNSPLVAEGRATANVYVNRIGGPEDHAPAVIEADALVPCVVAIDHARHGALIKVANADGSGFRNFTVPEDGYAWLSLGSDGKLRAHKIYPPAHARELPDGSDEADAMMLEFITQQPGTDQWALRQKMRGQGQYKKESDPFSGIH
jgi:hypothetical protein